MMNKNHKIVQLIGGTGNQMSQYAFARALGNDVKLDKTAFDSEYKTWPYRLDDFNIVRNFATPDEIKKLKRKSKWPQFIRRVFNIPKTNIVQELDSLFYPDLLAPRKNAYYIGYFQNEKYFKNIRSQLLQELSLKKPLDAENEDMLKQIKSVDSVSLHVRRGDYLKLKGIYEAFGLEYYENAIEYIVKHVDAPHFFVFSDDIAWVRDNLKINQSVTYVDINDKDGGCFDLELMKNCKHNIIANSSFSWWGAWLNDNPDKIVIAPKQWFADGRPYDIVPESWIKL